MLLLKTYATSCEGFWLEKNLMCENTNFILQDDWSLCTENKTQTEIDTYIYIVYSEGQLDLSYQCVKMINDKDDEITWMIFIFTIQSKKTIYLRKMKIMMKIDMKCIFIQRNQ